MTMPTETTPNMGLILPVPLMTAGPGYAYLLDAAQYIIDAHDHSSGKGVQITPAGINISSDLTFAQNNATNLRTARLYNNSSFSAGINDKTCLYALNNELYYIDGAGNNVQITLNGALDLSSSISLINIKDTNFTLEYFGDTSRKAQFSVANVPASTTNTYAFPALSSGTTDTLVTDAATQTLTNKTLTGNTAANLISGSGTLTLPTSGTITVPNGTDTLVTLAASQILTNKTLGTTIVQSADAIEFMNSANTFYTSLAAGSNTANYAAKLPIADGTSGQVLQTNGSGQWSWTTVSATNIVPTMQVFTSGSGTYTTPTSPRTPLYLKVIMVGGGGGGAGSGTSAGTAAGNGVATTFGTLLTANGGGGGSYNSTQPAQATATISSPAYGYSFMGSTGEYGQATVSSSGGIYLSGGEGANTPFGGAGVGSATTGKNANTNTGAGGGGGGVAGNLTCTAGSGGNAGAYIVATIPSPSSTYAYAVGSGGAIGGAGPSGQGGGTGAAGIIIVEEFYE